MIRWALKTAPGRKPQPVTEADVGPAATGKRRELPVQLSPEAIADGWRGMAKSAPQRIHSAELAGDLKGEIYGGKSGGDLFLPPFLLGLTGVLLLFVLLSSKGRSKGDERHGRRTKGPELGSPFGPGIFGRDGGIRFRLLSNEASASWAKWLPSGPSFRVPKRLESSHIMLMGDTGSGKSSAIRQILRQVEGRGESAIVYDPAMDFVGEFYSPERGDLILNPLDERCPHWNLDQEILRDETATAIAAAFLPDKEYEKAFFTDAPRRLLAHMLRRRMPPHFILQWMSDPETLAAIVERTPLAALIDMAAPAQRSGVLSSLNLVADSFELLPKWDQERPGFTTAEWLKERKRWVFLTSSPDYREKVLPLHSVWLDLFILRMQSACEAKEAKPVWFVIDELASLNKLPQLHTAVTENRKYGNPVVLGFQGRSQMEKRYGQDAEAMLSQPATKIFFKTSEPRAAKWVSETIGEIEVERLKESRSMGLMKGQKSYALEIATKPLVMPSEISGLEPLRGFIKQENRVVPVRFQLAKKRKKQPEFIERKMGAGTSRPKPAMQAPQPLAVAPEPVLIPETRQSTNIAIAQSRSPLSPLSEGKSRAVHIWDESKGIE
jgi:hypothetical protein